MILDREDVIDVPAGATFDHTLPDGSINDNPSLAIRPRISHGSGKRRQVHATEAKRQRGEIDCKGIGSIEPFAGILKLHGRAAVTGIERAHEVRRPGPLDANIDATGSHARRSRDERRR